MNLKNEITNIDKREFQIDAEVKNATTGEKIENLVVRVSLYHNKNRKAFYAYTNAVKFVGAFHEIMPYEGIFTRMDECPRFSEKRFFATIENLKKIIPSLVEQQIQKSNEQENRNIALA